MSLIVRFLSKVKVSDSGCWEWQTFLNRKGYGTFYANGHMLLAHRLSYAMRYGGVPEGMFVCHRCDNPKCVNPEHLFLGTNDDNVLDMLKKGRHRPCKGEMSGRAKLTEKQVIEIRRRAKEGGTELKQIAKEYGVSPCNISNICRGYSWKHLV